MILTRARYLKVGQAIELYPTAISGYLTGRYNSIFISTYIEVYRVNFAHKNGANFLIDSFLKLDSEISKVK